MNFRMAIVAVQVPAIGIYLVRTGLNLFQLDIPGALFAFGAATVHLGMVALAGPDIYKEMRVRMGFKTINEEDHMDILATRWKLRRPIIPVMTDQGWAWLTPVYTRRLKTYGLTYFRQEIYEHRSLLGMLGAKHYTLEPTETDDPGPH